MEDTELPPHIIAEGPDGLMTVLNDFLEKSEHDPDFSKQDHYILYQLNQQKALIKVDMAQKPFHFWYYDLLGRPATKAVKETIGRFLWEKCGERENYLTELAARK